MSLRTLSILLVFALMYYLVFYYKVVIGLFFYYVQTVAYVTIILLAWGGVRDYFKHSYFTVVISLFVLSYLSVYMMLGFWSGFGLTPYSLSPTWIFVNVVYTTSKICALEFLRVYIVNALKYRSKHLAVYVPTVIVWFLTWFPYPLLSLTLSIDSLKILYRYFIPSFISSAFSTFIVLNHGVLPSILYNVIPQIFIRIVPFLPRIDWFVEGTVNAMVPLIGYSIALPYSRTTRKSIKKLRSEIAVVNKMIVYFALIVVLIAVSQGYVGFRLYVISSGSMEPTIRIGDIVVICNYCRDFKVNDIVAYVSKWGVIVHRIVEIREDQGYVVTKGDANREPDSEPVPFKNILGRVVLNIPVIGYASIFIRRLFADNIQGAFLTLLCTTLVLVIPYVFKRLKRL